MSKPNEQLQAKGEGGEHMTSQTKSVLILVFLGLLAGTAIGLVFITITSVWYALRYGVF